MEKAFRFFDFQFVWNADREAVYDSDADARYTYRDLEQRAERAARFLTEDLGLKKGDCVALCARNAMAHYDLFFAAWMTGVIITTYNHKFKPAEFSVLMNHEKPEAIFYDSMLEDLVDKWSQAPYVRALIVLHGISSHPGVLPYTALMEKSAGPLPPAEIDPEDTLMYIHTGGSTGTPKASKMSYRAVICNCIGEILSFGLSYRDVGYQFLPLFHTGGWNVINLPLLFCGGKMVLRRDLEPGAVLRLIAQEKVTVGVSVPTIYAGLAEHPDFPTADFSSVRWLLVGAAPIRQKTLEQYLARGVKLCNSYGMTEVGPNNLSLPVDFCSVDELRTHWNSVGKPMLFNEVKIVNDAGEPVPPGEPGELCFRGPLLFSGYFDQEEETKQVLRDGWLYTGDVARQDEEGYLYVVGRKKNVIIFGGENIFPVEIEECISKFVGVREVCVYGVPDEKWGEVPHALIVPQDGPISQEALEQYLKRNLSGAKRPRVIHFVDSIPRGSVGKVDYRKIRELYS